MALEAVNAVVRAILDKGMKGDIRHATIVAVKTGEDIPARTHVCTGFCVRCKGNCRAWNAACVTRGLGFPAARAVLL